MSEQLYGHEGIEADMGYVPMPAPTTDEPSPELEHAEAIRKWADDRAQQSRPIVERSYFDEADKPQEKNKTVEMDRAARDLSENREAEAAIAEMDRNAQLAAEIDQARGLRPQPEAQPELQEQPHTPLVSELQQPQSSPTESGQDEIVRVLQQNPKVLAALHQQHAANVASVETAVNNATQFAQQNAALAVAAIIARPELQGVPPGQYAGALQALKVSNPTAHAEIGRQIANTQAVVQQALQTEQAQKQRYAAAFQAWGNANDDAFDKSMASESPESFRALKDYTMQMMRGTGLSDADLLHQWNSNVLLRSAQGQGILADAARWRMMKAGIKPAPKPIPQVSRPGSSMDRPAAADRDSFALEQRFPRDLNVKQATQLLQGRRARGR
jgi:hypothetical protein